MIDWNKYIGIPYVFNGRDLKTGVDCAGLIVNLYKDQGWKITSNDGRKITDDWFVLEPYRFVRYLMKHFDRVESSEELEDGDLILVEINGESHGAIYSGYGTVLTTFPQVGHFNGGVSFLDRVS